MLPVSTARGESWFPAMITTGASGSAVRSRENWRNASAMAVFDGRTVWKTSPATRTRSGSSSMTRSSAARNASATSRSRALIPPGASRW